MLTDLAGPGVMGSSGCLENENSFTIEQGESDVSIVKGEAFVPRFALAVHPSSAFIGACLPTSLALELWGVQDAWKMKILLRSSKGSRMFRLLRVKRLYHVSPLPSTLRRPSSGHAYRPRWPWSYGEFRMPGK